MSSQFKFSNLLGTVYNNGNLIFSPDGNTLISPVGNRITLYDLKNNKSQTLPIESRYNFTTLALSPNGILLIAINEPGEVLLCSLPYRYVVERLHLKRPIKDVKYSPDGRYIAFTKEKNLFLYQAPQCINEQFYPFKLEKVFKCSYDETLCIDWTSDSSVIAVGGMDMTTKIYAIKNYKNLSVYTLGSHTDVVVGCFFEENSLNIYTLSKNGQICVWDCSIDLGALEPEEKVVVRNYDDDEEDDIVPIENEEIVVEEKKDKKFFYKRVTRRFLKDSLSNKEGYVTLSAAAFHKKSHMLVVGFSNGAFFLYEMPSCSLVHSFSTSNQMIGSVAFNSRGDWIALGCVGIGQLAVWAWQTESFIMKQQGHFNNMRCLSYSPDGTYIATGGNDGKVKLWETSTGFCTVTFSEHGSSITGVAFSQNGNVVLSSSEDGTVRAFDLKRFRNFRTFTTPRPTKFSCLTVDQSGDIVCAGSEESFEIYVWGVPTGLLLSVLAGHEAPVSSISFSPTNQILASTSWDKTVRFWNVCESKSSRETITLTAEGLCITYKPDGNEVAVSTLDGQLSFFNSHTSEQSGSIEGRSDLYIGRRETDLIKAKTMLKSQAFTSLCYTADGECILGAGRSKFVCLYNIKYKILLKKFEITCNLSFDGVRDFINRRKMTSFGNKALIEKRIDEETQAVALPGSKKIDKSSRAFKPEINVSCIRFSPTGRAWAAATTEGLLVYSLDNTLVLDLHEWVMEDTPENVRKALHGKDYMKAIMMAVKLNKTDIITEVLEAIPVDHVKLLTPRIPQFYVEKLVPILAHQLEASPLLEFYLIWIRSLLTPHIMTLKTRSVENMSAFRLLQRNLNHILNTVGKVCNEFKYLRRNAIREYNIKKKRQLTNEKKEELNDTATVEDSSDDELMRSNEAS